MVFTRGRDVEAYMKLLQKTVVLMAEDLHKVGLPVDSSLSVESIIDSYMKQASGPTVLEELLIQNGCLTMEQVQRNSYMAHTVTALKCYAEEANLKKWKRGFKWITFSLEGKEIAAISIKGSFPGEVKDSVELLAYEHGVDPEKIEVGYR